MLHLRPRIRFNTNVNEDPCHYGTAKPSMMSVPHNVVKTDAGYTIELRCPGINKEHIAISFDKSIMSLEYKHERLYSEIEKKYTRKQFEVKSFEKQFHLPKSVDIEQIEAVYSNGILEVKLPLQEKNIQTIKIK